MEATGSKKPRKSKPAPSTVKAKTKLKTAVVRAMPRLDAEPNVDEDEVLLMEPLILTSSQPRPRPRRLLVETPQPSPSSRAEEEEEEEEQAERAVNMEPTASLVDEPAASASSSLRDPRFLELLSLLEARNNVEPFKRGANNERYRPVDNSFGWYRFGNSFAIMLNHSQSLGVYATFVKWDKKEDKPSEKFYIYAAYPSSFYDLSKLFLNLAHYFAPDTVPPFEDAAPLLKDINTVLRLNRNVSKPGELNVYAGGSATPSAEFSANQSANKNKNQRGHGNDNSVGANDQGGDASGNQSETRARRHN